MVPKSSTALEFLLTYLSYSCIYFARKPISIVKSTLEKELSLTPSQLGLIDTGLLGSYAIGQIFLGTTVEHLGRSIPIVLGYLLCGTFTFLMGMTSKPAVMTLLWSACGFFAATVNPLMVIRVADLYPSAQRASVVGLWQTSQQMGGVLSNGVASFVLAKYGWRAVFYVSGLSVVVWAFPLFFLLTNNSKRSINKKVPEKEVETSSSSRGPLSVPGAPSLCFTYAIVKMTRYCLVMWLPYFLTRHVKMNPASSGVVSTIFDITGAIGSVLSGLMVDKVLKGRMIFVALPFSILSSIAFLVWSFVARSSFATTSHHVWLMAIVGFMIATPDGILGGAASRNLVDYAGLESLGPSVAGLVNGCGSVGAILQGIVTAYLVEKIGWSGLFAGLSFGMAVASLSLLGAVRVENRALGIGEKKSSEASG